MAWGFAAISLKDNVAAGGAATNQCQSCSTRQQQRTARPARGGAALPATTEFADELSC
eukprot:NODE_20406_length_800_cov_0.983655.p4 GENE.NODE_20406_length_800_cov_0.983655~~NODE_20406_length_800_cov_0.983655.p4  ORF type:complete len:58 (-),score=18.90 NODE_20406_length_800_cov_0.983655:269-442(-)